MKRFLVFLVLMVCLSPACNWRAKKQTAPELPGWGAFDDPDGDCSASANSRRLTISVPARVHDLNPQTGLNAPRALQEVKGDFIVTVKVTGEFEPGESGFNGAGLLLWADADNFVRLERNKYWMGNRHFCYPPLFEYFQNGVYQNTDPQPTTPDFFRGNSTWLRFERTGVRLSADYSHDGRQWQNASVITVELPSKVQVGVAAVNTSQRTFTVTFEEFSLQKR
jgi:regulation of enolase protein 1 (concanavalin A-like superfamily)